MNRYGVNQHKRHVHYKVMRLRRRSLSILYEIFPDLHKAGPLYYGGGMIFAVENSGDILVLHRNVRSGKVAKAEMTPGGIVYPTVTIDRTARGFRKYLLRGVREVRARAASLPIE